MGYNLSEEEEHQVQTSVPTDIGGALFFCSFTYFPIKPLKKGRDFDRKALKRNWEIPSRTSRREFTLT